MKHKRQHARSGAGMITALAFNAILFSAHPTRAAFLFWDNPAGGSAATSSNWNPSQVPVVGDDLFFEIDAPYSVTFSASVPQVRKHHYSDGTVTLSLPSPHTIRDQLLVSGGATGANLLRIPSGTLTISEGGTLIASGSTSTGTIRVNGGALRMTGLGLGEGGLTVGASGDGWLDILSGGDVLASQEIIIASGTTGIGRISVAGAGSTLTTNPGADLSVGEFGDAILEVFERAVVTCGGSLFIAHGTNGTGTMEVEGSSLGSDVFVEGPLEIGSSSIGVEAGVALLHIKDKGRVTVNNVVMVGDPSLANATLRVDQGGLLVANDISYHDETSILDFRGGVIRVDGPNGDFDPPGTSLVISSTTGTPLLELVDGSEMKLSSSVSPFRALQIGTTGQGELQIQNGAACTITNGNTVLGANAGSIGYMTLDGGSTYDEVSQIYCGSSGVGAITVQGGSTFNTSSFSLGLAVGGEGAADILGVGSSLNVSSGLNIGGTTAAPAGAGILSAMGGGEIHVTGAGVNTRIWNATGALNLYSGASLTSSGTVDLRGIATLDESTLNAQTVDFNAGGQLVGNGVVAANILADDATCAIFATGGPFTLGNGASNSGFANQGSLSVGLEHVTLMDLNGPLLGNASLGGGILEFAQTATLAAGKTLSGAGLVDGSVANSGTIAAAGTGLRFSGLVTGVGQGISGTLVNFLGGGGFLGAGTIACRVDGDAGSILTANGDLTVGNLASSTGVVLDGQLHVGAHDVTLRDRDSVGLGSLTTIAGGRLEHTSSVILAVGDRLSGTGTVATLVTNGGSVAPGASAGELTAASFTNLGTGVVEIELGDHDVNERDVLRVADVATFAGTLRVIALPSFDASLGDAFIVSTYGTRVGTFSNVTFEGFPVGVTFTVEYNASDLILRRAQDTTGIDAPELPGVALPTRTEFAGLTLSTGGAEFELGLPADAEIRLDVFDIRGRRVAQLADGRQSAGWHRYSLDRAPRLAAGVFFGRLEVISGGRRERQTARVVLIR